jgi:hypothetical protein
MAQAKLEARDHTKILELVLVQRTDVLKGQTGRTPAGLLRKSVEVARTPDERTLLRSGLEAAEEHRRALLRVRRTDKVWRDAGRVAGRIALFDGDARQLAAMLRTEAGQSEGALKVGLEVAAEIALDGADTIYNPDFWVAEIIFDPRQIISGAVGLFDDLKDVTEKAKGVAKDDAIGAVAGAAGAAATGAGAGAGAVGGAVSASVKSGLS